MKYPLLAIAILFFLDFRRNMRAKKRKQAIEEKMRLRESSHFNWSQFETHYINDGFSTKEIEAVKMTLQDYSRVAQSALYYDDHLFDDLLISNYGLEIFEIIKEIELRLRLGLNNDSWSIGMNPTVNNLFKLIHSHKLND